MKSGIINSIGVLLFVGSLLMGCEKDYQVYDADLEAIRFSTPTDSMVYSFALMPGVETDTVEIPLQILGFTAAADRVAEVVVVSEKNYGDGGAPLSTVALCDSGRRNRGHAKGCGASDRRFRIGGGLCRFTDR